MLICMLSFYGYTLMHKVLKASDFLFVTDQLREHSAHEAVAAIYGFYYLHPVTRHVQKALANRNRKIPVRQLSFPAGHSGTRLPGAPPEC